LKLDLELYIRGHPNDVGLTKVATFNIIIIKNLNRKTFLITSLGFLGWRDLAQSKIQKIYSISELTGKGLTDLYSLKIPLLKTVAKAFLEMQNEAKKENISIEIVSGYRSYNKQKTIWNRKFNSNAINGLKIQKNIKKIIEYSTIPGTSRHHWGTDIDLIDGSKTKEGDVLITKKFNEKGTYWELKKWMDKNAENFGFVLAYTNDPGRKGFNYEPWHYSFAPISVPMLKSYLDLNLKEVLITSGLEGKEYLSHDFISKYIDEHILGINHILKSF